VAPHLRRQLGTAKTCADRRRIFSSAFCCKRPVGRDSPRSAYRREWVRGPRPQTSAIPALLAFTRPCRTSAVGPLQPVNLQISKTGVQREPPVAPESCAHVGWHEAVIGSPSSMAESMTGMESAAVIRRGRPPVLAMRSENRQDKRKGPLARALSTHLTLRETLVPVPSGSHGYLYLGLPQ